MLHDDRRYYKYLHFSLLVVMVVYASYLSIPLSPLIGAPSLRTVLDSDFDRYLSDKLNAVLSIDELQGLKHSDQQVLFELYQEGQKPIDEDYLKSNLLFLRANQRWKDNLAMLANIRGSSASSN